LAYIVAALTLGNALMNCWILFTHPSFTSGELNIKDNPFSGYSMGEDVSFILSFFDFFRISKLTSRLIQK
jgi:hypothetical protein